MSPLLFIRPKIVILEIYALCIIILLFAFNGAENDLIEAWGTEEYSHGFFIPVIASLIALHKLSHNPPTLHPSWWGLPALFLATGLAFFTHFSALDAAAEYGIIISLLGISLACLGRRATNAIRASFIYLIFAIPLPHLLQADLSQSLQLISSSLGVWPLDAMGIPVFQEGNIIDLGGYRLQVVDACSGLRYLFPLMSFGYLVAILLEDKLWKRIILVLSTIPISIGLNALRITIIGITVDFWGQKMAEGFIHTFEGWVVFLICLALLMGETCILLHIGKKNGRFRYDYIGIPHGPFFSGSNGTYTPAITALVLTIILAGIFGTNTLHERSEIVPRHSPLSTFPLQLGDWRGHESHLTPDVLDALKLSDYWFADYQLSKDDEPINFYIAYYDSQRVGTTTHSPSNCIPGGGWQIKDSHVLPVNLSSGITVNVTRLIIQKDRSTELVYYWFDERGRDLTETYYAKAYLFWDSIMMHRTDGALVRLVTPLNTPNEALGDKRLHDFLDQAYPSIKSFIPGP